jgi:hypothetical protein
VSIAGELVVSQLVAQLDRSGVARGPVIRTDAGR